MSNLNEEQLQTLSKLSRIQISKDESKILLTNLKKILSYIDMLDEIDTETVQPCNHVIKGVRAPLRDDEPERLMSRDEFLRNSPDKSGGFIKVPQVIKDQL